MRRLQVVFFALASLFAVAVNAQSGSLISSDSTNTLALHTSGYINVREPPYNAKGDGVTDDTGAIQAAVNAGVNVVFPAGVYLTGPLAVPATMKGGSIVGAGYAIYGTSGTTLLAKTAGQASILAFANGADNIAIRGLRIDGNGLAQKGIDGTYGAGLFIEGVGVFGTTAYGAYLKQGVMRIRDVFFGDYPTISGGLMVQGPHANQGVGVLLHSDSTVADSEIVGGTVPLLIASGGNAIDNVWVSDGTQACIQLSADSGTQVINTRITNSYLEQPHGGAVSTPILDLVGTSGAYVQNTTVSNTYFNGSIVYNDARDGIVGFVRTNYAIDVSISGGSMRGQSSYATPTRYTDYAVQATNTIGLSISGVSSIRGVNRNVYSLTNTQGVEIAANNHFDNGVDWNAVSGAGHYVVTGDDGANVLVTDTATFGVLSNNYFDNAGTYPYALKAPNTTLFGAPYNLVRGGTATPYVFANGNPTWSYQIPGAAPVVGNADAWALVTAGDAGAATISTGQGVASASWAGSVLTVVLSRTHTAWNYGIFPSSAQSAVYPLSVGVTNGSTFTVTMNAAIVAGQSFYVQVKALD